MKKGKAAQEVLILFTCQFIVEPAKQVPTASDTMMSATINLDDGRVVLPRMGTVFLVVG